eukprot:scaffold474_cov169-Ochromonas_danica.AAC.30
MKSFVIDRFEEAALRSPNSLAIVCEDDSSITYTSLDERATTIAKRLVKLLNLDEVTVFEQTSMVGLLMERHIGIITMMLGIHKAGCAYVPVDPAFPPDRQAYILEHARCNVLIVDKECYANAKENNTPITAKHILISDRDGHIISHLVDGAAVSDSDDEASLDALKRVRSLNHQPEAIAYVLYTSGSTGKPKGVAVKQVGVDNIIHFFAEELNVSEKNRVLGLTTFCFDISVLEIFVTLTRGACFVLALSSTRKDPFRILELMESHSVTIFQATPTTYEMMLATGWTGDEKVHFLVGGEAFRPSLLPIAQKCASFLNVYGPTETTIWSTSFRIEKDFANYATEKGIKAVPIGTAISETLLYLVGENQPWTQVPQGEEGELWIGGIGVAAGYLHAPHLTQERFIPNPFGEGHIYRTGDVVKQLPDGNYIFVRRLDDQVKIDGFRIELEEIEKVYMEDDHIEKAVALVRSNKLVLYILPKANTPVITNNKDGVPEYSFTPELLESIHNKARAKLTYYMIPKYTVIIKDFAKTPNGKLDKKALPDPKELHEPITEPSQVGVTLTATVATAPDAVRPVSAIICGVILALRGHRPSSSNNLGAFGLDSLGSVMLLRQLTTALHGQVMLKLDELFVPGRTIRDLGQILFDRCNSMTKEKLHLISETEAESSGWEAMENGEACGDQHQDSVVSIDYYGASLLGNKRLFEGLRGVFTFMVLYDHWHSNDMGFSHAMLVDTTFFYLLSGFTTASQLRMSPEIKKAKNSNANEEELDVAPKGPFQVFGMDLWGYCLAYGPSLRYATALINCMLIYGAGRYIWTEVLRRLTSYTSTSDICTKSHGFTQVTSLRATDQDWRQVLGNISLYLSYNLYHPAIFAVSFVFLVAAPALLYYGVTQQDLKILNMLAYFLGGAWLLAFSEMACWWRLVETKYASTGKNEDFSSPTDHINEYTSYLKNWAMSLVLPHVGAPTTHQPVIAIEHVDEEASPCSSDTSAPTNMSIAVDMRDKVLGLLWRFSPDFVAVGAGLLLSCTGGLCRTYANTFTDYNVRLLLPCIMMLFILISVHQRGISRYNFSRVFLESDIMNFLGYASYPTYLLQDIILEYYFTYVSDHKYAYHPSNPNRGYFQALPLKLRVGLMVLFIIITWGIQKVFQDYLVANTFSKALEWWSKRRSNNTTQQYSSIN